MYTARERAWCKRYEGRHIRYLTAVYCCCCCCAAAAATVSSSAAVENICTTEGGEQWEYLSRWWRTIYEKGQNKCGAFHVTYSARRFRTQSLVFWSKFSDVECPEHRNGARPGSRHASHVPTAPSLAPQPKGRERTLGRRRASCLKNLMHSIDIILFFITLD